MPPRDRRRVVIWERREVSVRGLGGEREAAEAKEAPIVMPSVKLCRESAARFSNMVGEMTNDGFVSFGVWFVEEEEGGWSYFVLCSLFTTCLE